MAMIFAAPDFGAAGAGMLLIGIVALVVCGLVLAAFIAGVRLLKAESKAKRVCGSVLVMVALLVPFGCCFGPEQVFRMNYGSYPLGSYPNGKLTKGMTADEVVGVLGPPHQVERRDGQEQWLYWLDSYELGWVMVDFEDGRVTFWGGS